MSNRGRTIPLYRFVKFNPMLDTLTFRELNGKFVKKFLAARLPGESYLNLNKCFQRDDEDVASYCIRQGVVEAICLKEDLERAEARSQDLKKKKDLKKRINDESIQNWTEKGFVKRI